MKNIFIFFVFSSLLCFQSFGQDRRVTRNQFSVEIANNTVRSIYGWKMGPKVSLNFNNRFEFNYAYLISVDGKENSQSDFQSTQVKYYINPRSRLNFGLSIKLGLHENQFASVIPSIELRYRPIEQLNISAGLARVDGFPYFDFSLGFRVFKK